METKITIPKELGNKVLMIGVSKTTYGGMASVLISYGKYFERIRFIPTWKLGNKMVKVFYAFQAILRCFFILIFDKNIKILHIHGAANASFYRKKIFVKLGKFFGRKVIMHQHAADFKEFFASSDDKQGIIDTLNLCDTLIVLSNSWREYFSIIGVDESKISILNNIVIPPTKFSPKVVDKKICLLFLGEISNRKGIYDLLKVLSDNKSIFQNKLLVRIGGNVVDGDINNFILQNDLSQIVTYEGWVSGDNKVKCLEWADVYILPSYNEGLPIAILEAMSYSHPVISTNVGGIPEILKSHYNGILIEPGNQELIKESLEFFINNPENIATYGNNAFVSVQSYFPKAVISNLTDIYTKLLINKK